MEGSDLKDRLLAEIERRLEDHEPPCEGCNHAQVLRALRREVSRHVPEWKETYDGEIQIDRWERCRLCRHEWCCPTIFDTARELGMEVRRG